MSIMAVTSAASAAVAPAGFLPWGTLTAQYLDFEGRECIIGHIIIITNHASDCFWNKFCFTHRKYDLTSIPKIAQACEQHTCFSCLYWIQCVTVYQAEGKYFMAALHSSRLKRTISTLYRLYDWQCFLRNSPENEPHDLILNVGLVEASRFILWMLLDNVLERGSECGSAFPLPEIFPLYFREYSSLIVQEVLLFQANTILPAKSVPVLCFLVQFYFKCCKLWLSHMK